MKWTPEQLEQYRRDGYYLARGLLNAAEVAALNMEMPALLTGDEAKDRMHREREKGGAVRQVYLAHRYSPAYRAIARNPKLLDPVKQATGNDVYVWHSKINVKDAFEGSVWLWHQDYGYWMWDGVEANLVSAMIMLDKATVNNGSLMVVAGSHQRGRHEHFADTVTTSYKQWCLNTETSKALIKEDDIRHVTGEPGDVLFFHCNLIHGSGHNMSPLPRKTFIVAYNDIANKPKPVENQRPDWVVAREFETIS